MKRYLVVIVVASVVAVQAAGQTKGDVIRSGFVPGNSGVSNLISSVSLSSSFSEDKSAKAEIRITSDQWTTFGLTVEQSISKGTKKAELLDIVTGITSGTKVSLNFQKMFWDPQLSSQQWASFSKAAERYAKRKKIGDVGSVGKSDIEKDGTWYEKMLLTPQRSPVFFNLQAGLERTDYSYTTDSVSITKTDVSFVTPSITANLAFPNIMKMRFWVVSVGYIESYKATDDVAFTVPFGTSGNLVSKTMAFGAPVKKYTTKVTLEYRKGFGKDGNISIAINPSVTWLEQAKTITLLMPVYLIRGQDKDGKAKGLQGGFSLGYAGYNTEKGTFTSFSDGFAAQVFITAPFDLFGGLKSED